MWDASFYSFPNFNGCNFEVWEWISNSYHTLQRMQLLMLVKGATAHYGITLHPWQALVKSPGRVLPLCWVIWMCRCFDPLFWHSEDWTWSFWGIFSHPPKRSFGVLKLPILTEFDLLGPNFHFSLDLFGSNFQRPAAHPHQFSDRVPPPPPG